MLLMLRCPFSFGVMAKTKSHASEATLAMNTNPALRCQIHLRSGLCSMLSRIFGASAARLRLSLLTLLRRNDSSCCQTTKAAPDRDLPRMSLLDTWTEMMWPEGARLALLSMAQAACSWPMTWEIPCGGWPPPAIQPHVK